MLSPSDAWKLLTIIKHTDHRSAAKEDAMLWATTINDALPDATLAQCVNAYAEWQSRPHDYSMVQPYELVAIVKSHHPSKRITEADIGRMLDPLNMTADERWAARRELIANVNRGVPREAALAGALDRARGRLLPSKPSRPKPTNNHYFAGRLSLAEVIGKDMK